MKKAGNKNLKIIAATSMAIFTLLTTFSATFAWFLAQREVNSGNENNPFPVKKIDSLVESIDFYKYIGTTPTEVVDGVNTTFYAFEPTSYGEIDVSDTSVDGSAPTLAMGTYSLSDPHHLIMIVFKIKHSTGTITANTDFSYIANVKATPTSTVASYSALSSVEVSSLADKAIYEVTSDEEHGNITTQYTFDKTNTKWNMSYYDLRQNDNPLSSAVRCYTFAFEEMPAAANHSVYLYSDSPELPNNSTTQEFRDKNATNNVSCITLNTADFKDSIAKSFVTISEATNEVTYTNEIVLYDNPENSTANYVAVVLDYYSLSLEYISYKFLGHPYLSDGLGYSCDWETVI